MAGAQAKTGDAIDRRNLDWYIDKAVQVLVFIGGVSGILFIIGIFIFITKEGVGFIGDRFSVTEFFGSARWAQLRATTRPTARWR